MRADLPELLPLICPACRHRSERGRELFTLSLAEVLRLAPDPAPDTLEVEEGVLACDNPACGRRYPILGGIPILLPAAGAGTGEPATLGGLAAGQLAALAHQSLTPQTAALLALEGPDDAPLPRLLEHLSIYLDAHWGDRATPPPDGPPGQTAGFGGGPLMAALAERAGAPVARAVELGCSVGRGLFELARGAELVVGVDLHLGALLCAHRLLRGQPLRYARRRIGRHYTPAQLPPAPSNRVALICGDALDPPLLPHEFERVVACNLLDSVPSPAGLLSVVDGLCAPQGELLLASPYSWQSGVVGEGARLGGADPAADLRAMLQSGGAGLSAGLEAAYTLEDERELTWELRRDARSAHAYTVHFLRARKPR